MSKKRKWLWITMVFVLVLIIFASILTYHIWQETMGSEKLSGIQTKIPGPITVLPPLTNGEADWPHWRGSAFDGKSDVSEIREDWAGGLREIWQVNYLCQGKKTATWSSVAVQGNRLVVPGRDEQNDLVFCLNAENGNLIWMGSYIAESATGHGPGARATPFIDKDRVYTFGKNGDLVCWQLYDGTMEWHRNVRDDGGEEPGWGYSSSPLIYKNLMIVQGGGTAMVVAYDKITGKTIWKSREGPAGYAALTFNKDSNDTTLIVFYGKGLSCLNPATGQQLWSTPWETSYDVNATTPAISGNILFMTSGYSRGSQALGITGTGFEIIWEQDKYASHHSDPIITDGYIYGYSGQSNQNRGDFVCLELKTGHEMWRTREIGWGTTIMAGGYLVCMDIKGNLYLINPVPGAFQKVAEMKNALKRKVTHPAWTVPVVANGKIYLRYLQQLICYDLK